jgi:hypothetical protein
MNTQFGRNQHPLGEIGSVHHWVGLLRGDPATSMFSFTLDQKRRCATHGEADRHYQSSTATIHLTAGKTQDAINQYFLDEVDVLCDVPLKDQPTKPSGEYQQCLLPSHSRTTAFSCPKFLLVDFVDGVVDLNDLLIMGFWYELRGATRQLPSQGISHFITYVKHDDNWYHYDGIGPRVELATINYEMDFQGSRNLFLYSKK